MSAVRWTDPAFVARAHRWMREAAARHGFEITGAITQPHVQPWSSVFRATTRKGAAILKACGAS